MNQYNAFPTILFFIFLILKLTGVIGWSWWWVTAPVWIPAIAAVVLIVIGLWKLNKEIK